MKFICMNQRPHKSSSNSWQNRCILKTTQKKNSSFYIKTWHCRQFSCKGTQSTFRIVHISASTKQVMNTTMFIFTHQSNLPFFSPTWNKTSHLQLHLQFIINYNLYLVEKWFLQLKYIICSWKPQKLTSISQKWHFKWQTSTTCQHHDNSQFNYK
jgi:hypothetical protein